MPHPNTRRAGELASETSYSGKTQDHTADVVHLEHFYRMLVTTILITTMLLGIWSSCNNLTDTEFGKLSFTHYSFSKLSLMYIYKKEDLQSYLEDSDIGHPPQIISTSLSIYISLFIKYIIYI